MNIALLGYGKMGKIIEKLATQKGHTIVIKSTSKSKDEDLSKVDIAIEFSSPEAAFNNITTCLENNIPVVSGTTGWLDQYDEILKLCKKRNGSFIYASNFSIGVNLFFEINDYLATLMSPWKEYTASIEEVHHIQKKDAPSGTAITLADQIIDNTDNIGWNLEKGSENEIQINAKRIEDVKGKHIINYKSTIDTISIIHEANNREGFALGAILAAEWLLDKKGIFTMKDVLNI